MDDVVDGLGEPPKLLFDLMRVSNNHFKYSQARTLKLSVAPYEGANGLLGQKTPVIGR